MVMRLSIQLWGLIRILSKYLKHSYIDDYEGMFSLTNGYTNRHTIYRDIREVPLT